MATNNRGIRQGTAMEQMQEQSLIRVTVLFLPRVAGPVSV